MPLHVHRSHRLESLADGLARLMRGPLESALESEIVVVQSLGMRRWLSLELARLLGVAMNVRFPFPAGFAQEIFRAAFPDEEEDAGFQRDVLPWRVLALFPKMLPLPGWEELRNYAEGELRALKEYQLAHRIAAVFDRYLAYRPEVLAGWESSRTKDWQAQLWRALVRGRRERHPAALLQRLAARTAAPGMPERVSIFGISSLPPLYLHLIENVARCLDVHLFLLEPTDQYWGDIRSRREQDRELRDRTETAEELHLDTGNPLLASLGKVGRDFTRLVQDLEPFSIEEDFETRNAEEGARKVLRRVQADIFELRDRAPEEREEIAPGDVSIQVHCCHGPMRELEVLHDQLLDLFERMPALTPRDILVAMPDVESYAPFIEAVFGSPEDERLAIPFTIADRTARAENAVADTFLRILDLHGSRFTASAVLALLESAAVRRRHLLAEADLETIRAWVSHTGIRWGIDENHRAQLGLPRLRENTWRAGIERLLLGYALPGDERTLFDGILPMRDVEGALALTLGHFVEFAEALFVRVPALAAPHTLGEWERTFREMVREFFDGADESADEVRRLHDVLGTLSVTARAADFEEAVSFEVIRAHLGAELEESDSGSGFLAGRVTFCALKPMRAIPFKVLCLLGMNDTAFPRRDTTLAFDLVSTGAPRRGDRSQRDDDRYLFLEAILSAREVLYLSYSGLSPRDNSEAPPSVMVSELLDYIGHDSLVTRHRLQPFSAAYFEESARLFSYSAENARSSRQKRDTGLRPVNPHEHWTEARVTFSTTPLADPGPEWLAVDLDQLANFFSHPAKFFVRERLRLAQPGDIDPLEECEPLALEGLARYGLGQELTRLALEGGDGAAHLAVARAGGRLAHGLAGEAHFGTMNRETAAFAATIRQHVAGAMLGPRSVDATFGDLRVTGTLHGLYPAALLRHRAAKLKGKDVLRAWIHHVALHFTENSPRETLLFGIDTAWRFKPLGDPASILADLLALYLEGLRTPLPLFPRASMEFARRTLQPKPREKIPPLVAARRCWEGAEHHTAGAESDDAWFALCFPAERDPFDTHWQELALRVFAPIFEAREEA